MNISIKDVWKTIFRKPKYIIITLLTAIIFYLLNVAIQNYSTLFSFSKAYGFKFTLSYFIDISIKFHETTLWHSYTTLIILSVLVGILVSLIVFKINNSERK